MTIHIEKARVSDLARKDQSNNPFIAYESVSASASTALGQELSAAANAITMATYNFWKANPASGSATLRITLDGSQLVGFVGLAAHNLSDIGATITLRALVSGGSWTDLAVQSETPSDNQAIGFVFREILCDQVEVVVSGASADVVIGVALVSRTMVLPRRLYQGYTPPITPTSVDLQSNVSEGGHLLGSSVVHRASTATALMRYVSPQFLRSAEWLGFQRAFNEGRPFFWAWRPEKYADLFYAWRSGRALKPTNAGPLDLMSFEMNMRFYDDP